MNIFFNKLYNWFHGLGFQIPEPNPKIICQYNYYKSILNNSKTNRIQAYEDEINKFKEKYPKATKELILKTYIETLEKIYRKENLECIVDM